MTESYKYARTAQDALILMRYNCWISVHAESVLDEAEKSVAALVGVLANTETKSMPLVTRVNS